MLPLVFWSANTPRRFHRTVLQCADGRAIMAKFAREEILREKKKTLKALSISVRKKYFSESAFFPICALTRRYTLLRLAPAQKYSHRCCAYVSRDAA